MSFGWLIWLLIFLFLLASDSRMWSNVWTGRGYQRIGRGGRLGDRRMDDFELRAEFRRTSEPDVVVVSAEDHIANPDTYLESMIARGELDRAREYRLEMEKMADELDDDESLRKYAVYGARISRRQKELAGEKAAGRERWRLQAELGGDCSPARPQAVSAASAPETISIADRIDKAPTPVISMGVAPPLWTVRKDAAQAEARAVERLPAAAAIGGAAPIEAAKVESIQPPPPAPRPPEPPAPSIKPPRIPADFIPPPPGPTKLGEPARAKDVSEAKKPKPEAKKKEQEISVDPDDYTDLISI